MPVGWMWCIIQPAGEALAEDLVRVKYTTLQALYGVPFPDDGGKSQLTTDNRGRAAFTIK